MSARYEEWPRALGGSLRSVVVSKCAAAAALTLLCSCATTPYLAPIPAGEAVAVSVVTNPRSEGVIQIRNDAIRSGRSTGSTSGAVVGGLLGILAGPFAPYFIPIGAAEGAAIGDITGAAAGATAALPEAKATELRRRIAHVLQTHSLLAELTRDVTDQTQKKWTLDSEQPATRLTVELQGLQLTSTRGERVRCEVRVLVYVEPNGTKPAPARPRPKQYEYVGPYSSLEGWLDENSDVIAVNLTNASQSIAAQIFSDLAPR